MANTMADPHKKRSATTAVFCFALSLNSLAQTSYTSPAQTNSTIPGQTNNANSTQPNTSNPAQTNNNGLGPTDNTGAAQPRDFTVTPTLLTEETYNDNVLLAPSGTPLTSAFITEITPRLAIVEDGPRFKMNFDYAIQHLTYSGDAHTERTNQMLAATSTAELIDHLLYLDDSANINQQNQTPFGQATPNNLSISSDRLTVRTLSIAPYLKTATSDLLMELRFMRDFVRTSLGALTDSDASTVSMNVKSGPSFKAVDWGLQYNDQTIYYPNQNNIVMESILANTGVHLTPEFALTASAGYEKDNYVSLYQTQPEGADWSAGFEWTPSERTRVAASAGHHFYGDTYMLNASERTFASVWSLGYNTGLTTSRSQFLVPVATNTFDFLNSLWQSSIPDAAQRQLIINAFIQNTGLPATINTPINTISDQVFLQKDLQGSVALTGAQNTILLSIFDLQRDAQTAEITATAVTNNLSLLNNTRQRGGNIIWNHTFGPRTNSILMDGYSRAISVDTGIAYNNNIITASLNHQLLPKLKATLQYERIRNDSNYVSGNYIQNLISAMLTFSF